MEKGIFLRIGMIHITSDTLIEYFDYGGHNNIHYMWPRGFIDGLIWRVGEQIVTGQADDNTMMSSAKLCVHHLRHC